MKRQERILIPRAKIGTEDVIRPLKEAGLSFDDIAVYDTREIKQTGIYDDSVDTSDKSIVIDWYYRKYSNGKRILH